MNAREIVLRTLEYRRPVRLAASFPEPYWHDLFHVSYRPQHDPTWRDVGNGRQEFIDEWGNTWARIDTTSKGEVSHGALEDWDDMDRILWPDLANPANFDMVRDFCADPANDRFRIGSLPGFPFNIARKMRRLDTFLMDVLIDQPNVERLLARIEAILADTIVQYALAGVDGVMFPEDWGTQESLMIRPKIWRQLFKPGFERLCAVAHDHGIKVLMHSCGKTTAIIPDLIETGIDCLQFDQPQLHGLDNLAQFHGQMTFWCPVDIQKTLQTLDEQAIIADAREMVEKLGGPEGGFIAGYYGDNVSIGLDPRWQDLACRTFMDLGDYTRVEA